MAMTPPPPEKRKKERPPKRPRNLSPASAQRWEVQALLANPDQEIIIPGIGDDPELLPPDILLNIQGSSAGAGSGEFHVYKASRKREFERIQKMDEEIERERSEQEFLKERAEKERALAEKTAKNRKRRDKKKGKKPTPENGKASGEKTDKIGLKVAPKRTMDAMDEENEDDEKEVPEGLVVIDED
jgi:hypothetical protein